MDDLIENWERLSTKCMKLGNEATNGYTAERYFAESQVYSFCADRLRRKLKEKMMRLQEWIEKQGVNDAIFKLAENAYRKGYNDGLIKANQIFADEEMDKLATDLISRVIDNEEGG